MKILSLDQSLNCTGWAVFNNNKLIDSNTFTIKSTLPIEQRLIQFWIKLDYLKEEFDFDFIAFEDIQNQGNAETYKKLAYVQAAILLWCGQHNIKYEILGPSHWRRILNIKGRKREEQKAAAIEYVKQECNINTSSDEADAVCIGLAYIKEIGKNESAF